MIKPFWHEIWDFTEKEQQELVGVDIGGGVVCIVVELDEWSTRRFYNHRFAPLTMLESDNEFQLTVYSIDDAIFSIIWKTNEMEYMPYEVQQKIEAWLKRSNYFVNLKGLEKYCEIFGKYRTNHN